MSLIRCRELSKNYQIGAQQVNVLNDFDFDVEEGDFVALMGPSGSGKTTLMNLVGGLDQPTGGSVEVGGTSLSQLSKRALAEWRAETVGFVFQFYHLLDALDARQNVELPLLLTTLRRTEIRERAETALELVGLADRGQHKPAELSGGQQQRVAIARAIVSDPALLLCDEPTGDLDRRSADEILDLLVLLNSEFGRTLLMVTHDPLAAERARRTITLDKGRIQQGAE